ncbi:DNA excision repair protein ERCC-5 homolog [Amia ocellicauda]|uniref:DNA excision repair protein ERCC-5 homolog n=1 Tax=Amia ocellicauda TaxID=2972642 RepID=UPI0034647B0E
MGVQGLWKLLECTGKPINPETLEGKVLAVDISIWLNQAVKGLRDRDGNTVQNAHLLTLFNRLCKLLFFRIRPIFVFDGDAPLLKKQTLALRRQRKEDVTKESKQTSEKLLRTFLKRQAIKAALGDRSQESLPSISKVHREEVDDIYVLPALEEKEQNSSDEEAEKEWEETANNRRMFQQEIFDDPNSVDIDSEEFAILPAEMKHEILKDMKEFSKKRRTLYETPPEKSTDFSQYQLAGLLKRNNLNHRIKTVEKEMNEQSSGVVSSEYSVEEGSNRSMETHRLMSEDTSHYILIKGSKTKEKDPKKLPPVMPWTSTSKAVRTEPPLWHPVAEDSLEETPLSPHRPSSAPQDESSCSRDAAAPPSPRTLQAIQAALLDSSSDEDIQITGTQSGWAPERGVEGNARELSPRTVQAIQKALTEDNSEENRDVVLFGNAYQQDGKVIDISSSDEEMVEAISERNKAFHSFVEMQNASPKETVPLKRGIPGESKGDNAKPVCNMTEQALSLASSLDVTKEDLEKESARVVLPQTAVQSSSGDLSGVAVSQIVIDSSPEKKAEKRSTDSNLEDGKPERTSEDILLQPAGSPEIRYSENKALDTVSEESDSEESFIEVSEEEREETPNPQLPEEISTEQPTVEALQGPPNKPESLPVREQDGGEEVEGMEHHVSEAQPDSQDTAAASEWEDISMEELEVLENSLSVQQSSLQAQKQQQERIAATVTGQMYLESQELLRLFGVPFIVAPMEAEAQCAILDLTDQTNGTITDDSDVWLFGARHVYKNFFSHNKYVEYYQYVDLQNQLGLDRSKLINLAYLLGSDYTEGIPGVGYISGMEILNEFPGPGMEPLLKFCEWWTEAQKNKKLRPNPNDTKVKKKLRNVLLHPGFPNPAVAQAYLKPTVDDSQASFSWGRPDPEQIKEFCKSRFGWNGKRTEETLMPVMKQLNAQQTQLRIDSFFRLEQQERQAIKSQRLRRAVTCLKRKERGEEEEAEEEEKEGTVQGKDPTPTKGKGTNTVGRARPNKRQSGSKDKEPLETPVRGGGFLYSEANSQLPEPLGKDLDGETADLKKEQSVSRAQKDRSPVPQASLSPPRAVCSSSSSEESDGDSRVTLVTAQSIFHNHRGRGKTASRGRKKRKV